MTIIQAGTIIQTRLPLVEWKFSGKLRHEHGDLLPNGKFEPAVGIGAQQKLLHGTDSLGLRLVRLGGWYNLSEYQSLTTARTSQVTKHFRVAKRHDRPGLQQA
ncbi:hypothetical protein A6X21_10655 [Planctopirus hydrillae]|uniref:Uncharacterized protein n=1 Tax=Planctopirus hydrillae TaxID=1841610 RepID=A0A1C3E6V2_9PLAN|nr:hypothetical protein A6X21_10655 [Planctopirus hydrillae]